MCKRSRSGASDYTDRRPYWAMVHEEAFSPEGARQKWMANIDWAKENGRMAGLVVHPWMLMINPGEVKVVGLSVHLAYRFEEQKRVIFNNWALGRWGIGKISPSFVSEEVV